MLDQSRQDKIVPADELADVQCVVAGVGSLGRPTVTGLARIGAKRVTIYDDDTVEAVNCAPQGYPTDSTGEAKVNACWHLANDFGAIYGHIDRKLLPESIPEAAFDHRPVLGDADSLKLVLFLCVDSLQTRKELAIAAKAAGYSLIIDQRMGGLTFKVLTVDLASEPDWEAYLESFDVAPLVMPCGQQMTSFAPEICAGMAICQFVKWLKGNRFPDLAIDIHVDLDMNTFMFDA